MFIQRKLEQKTILRGIRPWWGGNCCIQHVPDKSQEELLAAECWSNRSEQLTSARVEPQTFVLENSQLYCQRANGWNEDMGERFNKKQARKLVRCDSYLQNLITLLTDSLTHPIRRVGYRIKKVPDNKTRYSEEKHKHDMSIIFSSDQFEGGLVGRM